MRQKMNGPVHALGTQQRLQIAGDPTLTDDGNSTCRSSPTVSSNRIGVFFHSIRSVVSMRRGPGPGKATGPAQASASNEVSMTG